MRHESRAGHFYSKAMDIYSAQCDSGDAGGCYAVGKLYQEAKGLAPDDSKAAEYFTRSCNAVSGVGCMALADAYRQGKGVDRNLAKAELLIAKACKGAPANECAEIYESLGEDYLQGIVVVTNYDRAGANYKKSCDLGSSTGCSDLFNLAYDLDTGTGVAKNEAKAAVFYSNACAGGVFEACGDLGIDYHNGTGVAQDFAKAAVLYKKACNGGIDDSCANLGYLYWSGRGVEQDKEKGKALLQRTCTAGNKWSCDRLKEIDKQP